MHQICTPPISETGS